MITKKVSENEYEIYIYDWVELHDDYLCGSVKRDPSADEESDASFWMFYPVGAVRPMNVGDLRRIYGFISWLNTSD